MYQMRNIVSQDCEIDLPKCMYRIRNPNQLSQCFENDINICHQIVKLIKRPSDKMAELEQRQDQLLKKLDILYDRIKIISSICASNEINTKVQLQKSNKIKIQSIPTPEEIVLYVNPDNLPWYLFVFLKDPSIEVHITWHIHSSVANEKKPKILAFLKNFKKINLNSKINLRLIFSCVSTDSELKLSSLAIPIVSSVNILRYLSLVYPNTVPYDMNDHIVDGLLDNCYLLEKTPEKNKDAIIQKILVHHKDWMYKNEFSIVDVALYNVVKQLRNKPKSVPISWFEQCEKICN
ncbi:unnamed protein product [Diatraea saccharalis]|uniref:AIMP2 thioredoxin-like domain-containing protein n=1 Tax=Diatraea saccharalis TaxID=40085 RepID=A0A9N9W980_9NEOP|nr:unnamed protein product [Diatraea saccharalis]